MLCGTHQQVILKLIQFLPIKIGFDARYVSDTKASGTFASLLLLDVIDGLAGNPDFPGNSGG